MFRKFRKIADVELDKMIKKTIHDKCIKSSNACLNIQFESFHKL